jgi:lysophospholipase-2
MTFSTSKDSNGTTVVAPRNEADQTATVVLCHGLGDTAQGWEDVAENLASKLPYVKFILPTAKTQKVTMNMGMQMPAWYDIVGLDKRSNEICPGIDESQKRILDILKSEHDLGIPYNRMVLAGFSQGGALSLYTGMQLPPDAGSLAGIVMMSGYLPHASGFNITPGAEGTPIFHAHGAVDPLVRVDAAKESQSHVSEKGAKDYQLKIYDGLAHSANPQEVADVLAFLKKVLPQTGECYITLKDPSEMSIKELKGAIQKAGIGSKAVGLMEKCEFVELLKNHRAGKL